MKRALILLIVLLMAFGSLSAFADASEPIAKDYDELTVGAVTPFGGNFSTDMWGSITSDLDVRALIHGYDLVEWDSEVGGFVIDKSVVSNIVVTQNAAGDRTYTMTLCDDLYYCDGTKITAWDYAFSMLLSVAPQVAEIGGKQKPKDYIVGYEAYAAGNASYLAGVRVPKDDTIAITVKAKYLPFFYELGLLDCMPYPISEIAPGCRVADNGQGAYIANKDSADKSLFTAELLKETLLDEETGYLSHPAVTSGPYRLVSYDGQTVEMEINEYYKGNSKGLMPLISRLIYKTVSNETMIDQLAAGEVDLLHKCVSADVIEKGTQLLAQGDSALTMTNYMRTGLLFISFCCEQEPVNDVAVREAIALCLDKDGMVNDTVKGFGVRVDGYYGMGQWMYRLVGGDLPYPVKESAEDADKAAQDAYDAELADWQALNMDDVQPSNLDVSEAVRLLEENGWTLNRDGNPYDPDEDDVRCKDVDGVIVPLELKLICPEGSSANEALQANFADHLAEAGILLDIEIMPMQKLLRYYYREEPRDCQMVMLATNFDVLFDPSVNFMPDGETVNHYNATGIADETLYNLAVEMRQTQPGNALDYCKKWLAFEERFQELMPVISVYSNKYFDFYPQALHNYDISNNISWGNAIIGAYLAD